MTKLMIEAAASGNIVWLAKLKKPGQDSKETYSGVIDAETVDADQFVQSFFDDRKCEGDLNITMTKHLGETVFIEAYRYEDETDIHGVTRPNTDGGSFVVGRFGD